VIFQFLKMAAVRYLGFIWDIFGQPMERITVTKIFILRFLLKRPEAHYIVICIHSGKPRALSDTTATIAIVEDLLPSKRTLLSELQS